MARLLPALLFVTIGILCGCTAIKPLHVEREQRIAELHERLSYSISRHGFSHGLRGTREDGRSIDSIYISISLDSLKRRHSSLEQMLTGVARICASKEFADVVIRIEVSAADDADMQYMYGLLTPGLADAPHVQVTQVRDAVNDIVITVAHR
ncbi:MAG: hypothetical protein M0P39_03130 [Rhodocyclaceae bacterium]|nr:hypothetical protein [Rhodocyclaceae bacterium]